MTRAPEPLVAAGTALALALVLALGAVAGPAVMLPGLLLGQVAVVVGWYHALQLPGGYVGGAVAGATAAAADLAVVAGAGERPLSGVSAVLSLSVLAALLQQLARRDGRAQLTASLAATVTATVLTVLGASHLAALDLSAGTSLVATVGAGTAVTVAVGQAVTRGRTDRRVWAGPVLGAAAAAGAGSVVGAVGDLRLSLAVAAAVGAAGLAVAVGQLVARAPVPSPLLAGALPVVLGGPVAYVLGRLLTA